MDLCAVPLIALALFQSNHSTNTDQHQTILVDDEPKYHQYTGVLLSVTCGNGTCDFTENSETCQSDCRPSLVKPYYAQETLCTQVQQVYEPQTPEDVAKAVTDSLQKGRRIRITGSKHSSNSILCGDGSTISTARLDKIHGIEVFEGEPSVLVDAGVPLGDLAEYVEHKGYSLGFAVTGLRDITVGGAVATGAHGASGTSRASIPGNVLSLEVVGADSSIKTYSEGTSDPEVFAALRTSLGLLGVVTRLRIRLVPLFKLKVNIDYPSDDRLFEPNGAEQLLGSCDFGYLNWYPSVHRTIRVCAQKTDDPIDPGAQWRLINPDFPAFFTRAFIPGLQVSACNDRFACWLASLRFWMQMFTPPYEIADPVPRPTTRVVGYPRSIITGEFGPDQPYVPSTDWEVAIPGHQVDGALLAMRDAFDASNRCLPLVGALIRFDRAEDSALLAGNAATGAFTPEERVVHIEFADFRPFGFSEDRRRAYDESIIDLVEQWVEEFDARPHWGKNRDFMFEGIASAEDERFTRFQAVLDQLDPYGVFSNEWAQNVGFSWPHRDKDFSNDYVPGSNPCECPTASKPVCHRDEEQTFHNLCRALCDGHSAAELLPGPCHDYRFEERDGLFASGWRSATRFDDLLPTAIWQSSPSTRL